MRKAMGENLADDVAGESPDTRTRRLNLIKWAPLPAALAGHAFAWSSSKWACMRDPRDSQSNVPCRCPRWLNTSAQLPGGWKAALRQVAPSSCQEHLYCRI